MRATRSNPRTAEFRQEEEQVGHREGQVRAQQRVGVAVVLGIASQLQDRQRAQGEGRHEVRACGQEEVRHPSACKADANCPQHAGQQHARDDRVG